MRGSNWTKLTCACAAALFTIGCATGPTNNPQKAESFYKTGQVAESNKQQDDAAKSYERALSECPTHTPSLHALAQLRTQQGKYDVAIPLWRRYVVACNGSADALNDLAFCQDLAGWPAKAEDSYLKAIQAEPRHLFAHVNYGLMLARHDRMPEALCQLQCVLSPAEAHYNLGLALDEVGKTADAQAQYRKAIALDPQLTEAKAHLDAKGQAQTARTE